MHICSSSYNCLKGKTDLYVAELKFRMNNFLALNKLIEKKNDSVAKLNTFTVLTVKNLVLVCNSRFPDQDLNKIQKYLLNRTFLSLFFASIEYSIERKKTS